MSSLTRVVLVALLALIATLLALPVVAQRPTLPIASSLNSYYTVSVVDSVPPMSNITYTSTFTSGYSGVRQNQALGFTFTFFGTAYTAIGISYNGNLQWGTSQQTGVLPDSIPMTTLSIPVFGWFSANLSCVSGVCGGGQRMLGDAPNRMYIVRVLNWTYEEVTSSVGDGDLDIEVILYETTNVLEVRYYSVSSPLDNRIVSVGLQNGGGSNWLSVLNRTTIAQGNNYTSLLQGRTLIFTPNQALPSSSVAPAAAASSSVAPAAAASSSVALAAAASSSVAPAAAASSSAAAASTLHPTLPIVSSPNSFYTVTVVDSVPPMSNITYTSTFTNGYSGVRQNQALGFTFNFYGVPFTAIGISYNGNLQWGTSQQTGVLPDSIPMTTLSIPIFGWLSANLSCVSGLCGGGQRMLGEAPNRMYIVRVLNWTYEEVTNTAGDGDLDIEVILYETTNVIEVRYYSVSSPLDNRIVSVGLQNSTSNWLSVLNRTTIAQGNNYTSLLQGRALIFTPNQTLAAAASSSAAPVAASSSAAAASTRPSLPLARSPSSFYDMEVIDSVPTPPSLPAYYGSAFTSGSSGVRQSQFIGFPFNFFGTWYTLFGIGYNGNLQWGDSEVYGVVPPSIPSSNVTIPVLAWLSSDLNCVSGTCSGGYNFIGTAPYRMTIVRVLNWTYEGSTTSVGSGDVDVDIVLYETTNVIEVRYYTVSAPPDNRAVTIGMQNSTANWLSALNSTTTATVNFTSLLQGRTLRFTPSVPFPPPPSSSTGGAVMPFVPTATTSTNSSYVMTWSNSVPLPKISFTPAMNFSTGSNGVRQNISIGFTFYFYDVPYTTLGIGYNGNLQWGTSQVSGIWPSGIPSSLSFPILAWYASNLVLLSGIASGGHGVVGTAPNRIYVIRAVDWMYEGTSSSTGSGDIDVDILLYETTNVIEIRYYAVSQPPSSSYPVTLGVMRNTSDWLSVLSLDTTSNVTALLQGRTITYRPVSTPAVATPSSTGAAAALSSSVHVPSSSAVPGPRPSVTLTRSSSSFYNMEVIDSVPTPVQYATYWGSPFTSGSSGVRESQFIGFPFNFYGTWYTLFGIGYNGNLQWGDSATTGVLPDQIPSATTSIPIFAWLATDLNCVSGVGGGGYLFTGTAPYRTAIVRVSNWTYEGSSSSIGSGDVDIDIVLYETTNVIEVRYYTVTAPPDARTISLGMQNSTTNWLAVLNRTTSATTDVTAMLQGRTLRFSPSVPFPPPASSSTGGAPLPTVPTATTSSPSSYQMVWSNTVPQPKISFTPTANFTTGSNGVRQNLNIGFTFYFYDVAYTTLGIGYNGNLQWGSSQVSGILPSGIPSSQSFPILAWYASNLVLLSGIASGGYGLVGSAPNRIYVIRAVDWMYEGTTSTTGSGDIDVDILLYETTNVIEIRYYAVSQPAATGYAVTLGVLKNTADWVSVLSLDTSTNVTALLQGRTITFRPTPAVLSSSAAAAVVPSSSAAAAPASPSSSVAAAVAPSSSSSSSSRAAPVVTAAPSSSVVPVLLPSSSVDAPQSNLTDAAGSSSSLSSGGIAGIVIAAFIFLAITAFLVVRFLRQGPKWQNTPHEQTMGPIPHAELEMSEVHESTEVEANDSPTSAPAPNPAASKDVVEITV